MDGSSTRRTGQRGTRKDVPTTDPTKSAMKGEQRYAQSRNIVNQVNNTVWRNVGSQGPMGDTIWNEAGPEVTKLGPNVYFGSKTEKRNFISEAQSSPSVNNKKVIARNRAMNKINTEVAGSIKTPFNFTSPAPRIFSRDGAKHDPSAPFHFSTTINVEMGHRNNYGNISGGESRNESEVDTGDGIVRSVVEENLEDGRSSDRRKSEGGLSNSLGLDMEIEDARASLQFHHNEGEGSEYHGGEPGEERMELVEGGGATAFP